MASFAFRSAEALAGEVPAVRDVAFLLLIMQDIKDSCITAPEKRAVDDCADAVRKVFGVTS